MTTVKIAKSQRKGLWIVIDDQGRIHCTTPLPKDRAQAQADAMNARLAKMGDAR